MSPEPSCTARSSVPVKITPADLPGLYDVELSDGTVLTDITHGQVRSLTDTVDYPEARACEG